MAEYISSARMKQLIESLRRAFREVRTLMEMSNEAMDNYPLRTSDRSLTFKKVHALIDIAAEVTESAAESEFFDVEHRVGPTDCFENIGLEIIRVLSVIETSVTSLQDYAGTDPNPGIDRVLAVLTQARSGAFSLLSCFNNMKAEVLQV